MPQAAAEDPAGEGVVDFMREIRPILAQNCFMCHGPDEAAREGDLRLDVADGYLAQWTRANAEQGKAEPSRSAQPEAIAKSYEAEEFLLRVTTDDEDLRMPPAETGRTLTPEQIELLQRWIEQGAPHAEHWSFQPPELSKIPTVQDRQWPRNEIDHFILSRLEQEGIKPSAEAAPATLIRRLSLDLLGLLPTPRQVDEFCRDDRPEAYERLVDRLLESPHFGERWGRHWLDLARYADSDGYLGDGLRRNAYKYRDWVIDAVNRDLTFDQFTIQQLAGDLLPQATLDQKIATGFHRNSMKNTEAGADREEDRVNRTVDRVATTGTVWLGLTLGCVECHTHKFDPISHEEFYQFYAFFNNVDDKDLSKSPTITTAAKPRETRVHLRGDFRNPGAVVQPGTLNVLHPLRPRGATADRLDLAHWLVDPANPLTSRTAVNHIWKHLFARGLVHTVDDFGTTGETPSHPELLDWLAIRFSQNGWSRKALIKTIVTSSTYRQDSDQRDDLTRRDPYNLLLGRQARFRLEAEVIRDLSLAAAGLLEPTIGGPSILPPMNSKIAAISRNKAWEVSPGGEKYRRGMYILFRRATPYPMLTTFDAPDSTVACAQRERSNSPLQSLTLLNDPVFFECAQHLGRRLTLEADETPEDWIRQAYRICVSRDPNGQELSRTLAFVQQQRRQFADAETSQLKALVGQPLRDVPLAEQAVRVVTARVLMNLDEFITRE